MSAKGKIDRDKIESSMKEISTYEGGKLYRQGVLETLHALHLGILNVEKINGLQ